jgi:hypothetical protein
MTVKLANGATIAIENGTGANVAFSAITNANPAAVTSATHGLATGDFVEIVSGWSKLSNKIVRVTVTDTTHFTLDGVDTTLTSLYPAGSGAGTVAKVSGFTQLSQILSINTSGGEQQFLTYQLLEGDAQRQIPTYKTPFQVTMSVADDPLLAGFILAGVANDDRLPRAIKVTLADGSLIMYNGFLSINRTPSLTVNELMACQATIALLNEPVRY